MPSIVKPRQCTETKPEKPSENQGRITDVLPNSMDITCNMWAMCASFHMLIERGTPTMMLGEALGLRLSGLVSPIEMPKARSGQGKGEVT